MPRAGSPRPVTRRLTDRDRRGDAPDALQSPMPGLRQVRHVPRRRRRVAGGLHGVRAALRRAPPQGCRAQPTRTPARGGGGGVVGWAAWIVVLLAVGAAGLAAAVLIARIDPPAPARLRTRPPRRPRRAGAPACARRAPTSGPSSVDFATLAVLKSEAEGAGGRGRLKEAREVPPVRADRRRRADRGRRVARPRQRAARAERQAVYNQLLAAAAPAGGRAPNPLAVDPLAPARRRPRPAGAVVSAQDPLATPKPAPPAATVPPRPGRPSPPPPRPRVRPPLKPMPEPPEVISDEQIGASMRGRRRAPARRVRRADAHAGRRASALVDAQAGGANALAVYRADGRPAAASPTRG